MLIVLFIIFLFRISSRLPQRREEKHLLQQQQLENLQYCLLFCTLGCLQYFLFCTHCVDVLVNYFLCSGWLFVENDFSTLFDVHIVVWWTMISALDDFLSWVLNTVCCSYRIDVLANYDLCSGWSFVEPQQSFNPFPINPSHDSVLINFKGELC